MILSTDQIIRGVKGGQLVAPLMASAAFIETCVEKVRSEQWALRRKDEGTARLMQLVDEPLMWLKADIRQALLEHAEIFCLPLPLSLAYCESIDDRRVIVVGQGLIDLIAYRACCSYFEALLPQEMADYTLPGHRADLSALEILSNALMLLGCQLYTEARPPPDVSAPLNQQGREDCGRSISGALLFVLLHEFGHLQLGHLDSDEIRPMCVRQAVPDEESVFQKQEHEADQFASGALIDLAQMLAPYWQGVALNFYEQLELITGERSDSHPLAINRRLNAVSRTNELDQAPDTEPAAHVRILAARFLDTEAAIKAGPNALIATPRDACLRILREVVEAAHTNHGVDLRSVVGSQWQSWGQAG